MQGVGANRHSSNLTKFSTLYCCGKTAGSFDAWKYWEERLFPQLKWRWNNRESAYYALPAERGVHSGAISAEAVLASVDAGTASARQELGKEEAKECS